VAVDGGPRTFAGSPQPVEIHHRGIWYSGELLGWRHEDDGRVVARVRCVVDRLRHSAWKDLSDLRLPDPANPPHRAVAPPTTADPDELDRTRPHVLMAGLRSRPAKPEHAQTPPPRHAEPPSRPRREPLEAPVAGTRPEQLTTDRLERRRTYLGV
jgi:hypothetical protein